jgi:hypothetical protein
MIRDLLVITLGNFVHGESEYSIDELLDFIGFLAFMAILAVAGVYLS